MHRFALEMLKKPGLHSGSLRRSPGHLVGLMGGEGRGRVERVGREGKGDAMGSGRGKGGREGRGRWRGG
jgi:hypothetical protein